jgi:hypothetical protein
MVQHHASTLAELYEAGETAWLDATAELCAHERYAEFDNVHLGELLSDMARRDQKEARSRLTQLLTHLLEWEHQPKRRTRSWRGTILAQQQELRDDASTGVFGTMPRLCCSIAMRMPSPAQARRPACRPLFSRPCALTPLNNC